MITNIDKNLKDIAFSLNRIACALEEANKPKGLGGPYPYLNHDKLSTNLVSGKEMPLPTPWNNNPLPTCHGDYLENKNLSSLY
jgi:hypothetical protein